MKVQRRCDPKEVYEVMEESLTHYIIARGCNDIALRKKDYEPVQEWVTLYCLKDEWPCDRLKHDLRACWQGEYIVIQRKATR